MGGLPVVILSDFLVKSFDWFHAKCKDITDTELKNIKENVWICS